jgi:cell division protein ZapE
MSWRAEGPTGPTIASPDLRSLYARQLAERGFRADPVQAAVIDRLAGLRQQLIEAREADSSLVRRWFGGLGGKSSSEPVRGIYLWGGVGRGKTWMMDLFFQSLPFPERRRRHFHRFMHDVHAELRTLQQRAAPLEIVAERIARGARVLCFDELFVSDIADAMILGGLFDALFQRGVTLIATSNVQPRELYKNGLQRQRFIPTIELLERHLDIVAVEGATDYRLRCLTQAGTYLPSGAPDTRSRLQELLGELADHEAGAPVAPTAVRSIEIEGRSIPVVAESGGVVWFDFMALCSGPRSQNDYIEIARDYQSVIVSDVPVLDSLHEDEARRFIALVDELYDRNVNLIVSAAAAPTELYRGERLSFQFERTASRLIEMQSEEYLAREHRP